MKNILKKTTRYFFLPLLILLLLVFLYLKFVVRDIPPVDDSDMEIVLREIPERENAYPLLYQAQLTTYDMSDIELQKKFQSISDRVREKDPISDNTLDEFLFLFKEKLDLVDRISDMKYSQGSVMFRPEDRIMNFLFLRDISKVRLDLARRESASGDPGKLLDEAMRMSRFAMLVQQRDGGTSLISLMVGVAIKEQSLMALNEYLDAGNLPGEPEKVIAALGGIYESEEAWIDTWKAEYKMKKYVISNYNWSQFAEDFGLPGNQFSRLILSLIVHPERTKRASLVFDRSMIANSRIAICSELDRNLEDKIPIVNPFSFRTIKRLAQGEFGADIFLAVAIPNFLRAFDKRIYIDTFVDFTRLRIAALQYNRDHGELPEALADLAPEYIEELPFDRFAGKAIRYDRERKLIYSAGMNFEDNGGSFETQLGKNPSWNELREEKDLALRIMD